MTTTRTCPWRDKQGKTYHYEIYPLGNSLPAAPGNYILAREDLVGWTALYMGHGQDLHSKLEQFPLDEGHVCAIRRGVTHIHVLLNRDGEQAQQRIESGLIERYRPTCNKADRAS